MSRFGDSCLSATQEENEQRSKLYAQYCLRAAQSTTPRGAKSIDGVYDAGIKQVNAARSSK